MVPFFTLRLGRLLRSSLCWAAVRRFPKLHPETQSALEAATGLDLNGDGVIGAHRASADVEVTARELDTVDESAEVHQE